MAEDSHQEEAGEKVLAIAKDLMYIGPLGGTADFSSTLSVPPGLTPSDYPW